MLIPHRKVLCLIDEEVTGDKWLIYNIHNNISSETHFSDKNIHYILLDL